MGGKDRTSQRIDALLGKMLDASVPSYDNQKPWQEKEQKPDDPFRWEEYKNRPREFDDIEFARRQDEEQRRSELRGGS